MKARESLKKIRKVLKLNGVKDILIEKQEDGSYLIDCLPKNENQLKELVRVHFPSITVDVDAVYFIVKVD